MPTQPLSPADDRNYLGLGRQSVKGTAVPPAYYIPYVSQIDFGHNPNIREIREAGGGQVPARAVKDFLAPALGFSTPIKPDAIGHILALFLGTAGVPGGAGPYDHTFIPANGRELITFERSIADDVVERFVDGVMTGVTLAYAKRDDTGPELMAAVTVEAISEVDMEQTATAETYETERPFLRSDLTWTVDTSLNPTNVESCVIDMQKESDTTILADAVTRSDIVPLRFSTVSVELVQLFESADEAEAYYKTHYWDGTVAGTTPGELIFPGDLTVVADYGAGAAQRSLSIALPDINWTEAELTENDPEGSEAIRLTRRGSVVAGAGAPITALLKNNTATDYLA